MSFNLTNQGILETGSEVGAASRAIRDNFREMANRAPKCNFAATRAPLATDDVSAGYFRGSWWHNVNTATMYRCVANTANAAVWQAYSLVGHTHNAGDIAGLGSAALRASSEFDAAGAAAAALITAQATSLQQANNLLDLSDVISARANLGLGSAATADAGTGAGQLPQLDGSGNLVLAGQGTFGGANLVQGDDSSGFNNFVQMLLGYNGTTQYPHFVRTRHNASLPTGNAIEFYTGDGTADATFPANAILGLSIENGSIATPVGLNVGNGLIQLAGVPVTVPGIETLSGALTMAQSTGIIWSHPTRDGDVFIDSQTVDWAGNLQTVTFGPGYRGRQGSLDAGMQFGFQIESGWIPSAIPEDANIEHYLLFLDRAGTQHRPYSALFRKSDGLAAIYWDCGTNGIMGLGNSNDADVWLQYNGHGNNHDINGSFRTRGLRFNGWIPEGDGTVRIVDFGVVGTPNPNLTLRYGDADSSGTMRIQADAPTGLRFETLNNTPIMFDPGTAKTKVKNLSLSNVAVADPLDGTYTFDWLDLRNFNDSFLKFSMTGTGPVISAQSGTHLYLTSPASKNIYLTPGAGGNVVTKNLRLSSKSVYDPQDGTYDFSFIDFNNLGDTLFQILCTPTGVKLGTSTSQNLYLATPSGTDVVMAPGRNTVFGSTTIDASGNIVAGGTLAGSGSGLTSLNGSNISSGTVAVARLPVMVGSGIGHAAGLVPDPGSTAGSTHFLREDGTWAVPAGGGGGGSASGAAGAIQISDGSGGFTNPVGIYTDGSYNLTTYQLNATAIQMSSGYQIGGYGILMDAVREIKWGNPSWYNTTDTGIKRSAAGEITLTDGSSGVSNLVSGSIAADQFNIRGGMYSGFTGSGAFTNFTFVGGLCVAAS